MRFSVYTVNHPTAPHSTRQIGGSSTEIRLRDLAERPPRARKAEASGEPWTPRCAGHRPRSSRGLLGARKDQEIRDMNECGWRGATENPQPEACRHVKTWPGVARHFFLKTQNGPTETLLRPESGRRAASRSPPCATYEGGE